MRIALTAGYSKSLHAIALTHQLATTGHEVVLVLEVRLLSVKRLRVYLRQLGWRKSWDRARSRLLGRAVASEAAEEVAPMLDHLRAHGIVSRTVSQACRSVSSRHVRVRDLNTTAALKSLHNAQPDLVVYAGGGILRPEFIETPRIAVLNGHGGPLPAFRGMNATEWALFHGVRPTVAVHFMDTGIDTGPVLFQRPIPIEANDSIARIRGVATRVSVEALLEGVQRIAAGPLEPKPQAPDAGRQYFTMAEPLLEVLQRWLAEKRTPIMSVEEFAYKTRPSAACGLAESMS